MPEATLAQLYKVTGRGGLYRGGPAFYIARGLKACPGLGGDVLDLPDPVLRPRLQRGAGQLHRRGDGGRLRRAEDRTGLVDRRLAGVVIFGGIRRSRASPNIVVPFMAGHLPLVALYVVAINIGEVPGMLAIIVGSAFGLRRRRAASPAGLRRRC
jgi:alanine or glycine:cation symporter, AGCS family